MTNNNRLFGMLALGGVSALTVRSTMSEQIKTDPIQDFTGHGFEQKSLQTPLGRMNYYEAGQGSPLLFLHGIGGGASAWTWSKVAPAFMHDYRVIAPDYVGWGLSDHLDRMVKFEDYTVMLNALLDHIGQPVKVIAQGLSGGFIADLIKKTPDRFDGVILMSPAGGFDFGEDAFDPVAKATLTPIAKTQGLNTTAYRLIFHRRAFIKSWFTQTGFYEPTAVSEELVDGWLYSARQPNAAYSALPFLSGDLRFDFAEYLRDLPGRAVLVWGRHEKQIKPEIVQRLAGVNPNVPTIYIPRARTNFELELPAQTINVIREFFGRGG